MGKSWINHGKSPKTTQNHGSIMVNHQNQHKIMGKSWVIHGKSPKTTQKSWMNHGKSPKPT